MENEPIIYSLGDSLEPLEFAPEAFGASAVPVRLGPTALEAVAIRPPIDITVAGTPTKTKITGKTEKADGSVDSETYDDASPE